MGLSRYRLGDLLELTTEINDENKYNATHVRGMTITKEIIPTKANLVDTELDKFLVVHPQEFIFNPRTHGKKIGFGFNNTDETFLISWNNIAFRLKEEAKTTLTAEYLFLHFNRSEWDREACFRSWGSSTEVFSWSALCDMEIDLPPLDIQQKYVDVYNAMIANQQCYERGLEDLKLVCDAYIEELRRKMPSEKLGKYIHQKSDKNSSNVIKNVMGLSTKKEFREAQSRVNKEELSNYKIVRQNEFAFVPTTDTWKVLAFAYNHFNEDIVVSPIYVVFSVDISKILPEYLAIWLSRKEFDRYARYNSWGSARENFSFDDMCNVEIPIPSIEIQQSIVDIYKVYLQRKAINERLKEQIKSICPILIKGSLEEARKKEV